MTPGPNLSRYERPLAERRLLGGALRDRWESVDRLPPVQFLVRRLCRERPYDGVVAVPVDGPAQTACVVRHHGDVARGDVSE